MWTAARARVTEKPDEDYYADPAFLVVPCTWKPETLAALWRAVENL